MKSPKEILGAGFAFLFFLIVSLSLFDVKPVSARSLSKRASFYIANETVCVVDDVIYHNSDPIPSDDPCETCKCRPPGFACVLRKCEVKPGCKAVRKEGECCPQYVCGCEHNGVVYKDGDVIRNTESPCYTCYCQGSSIACALVDCYFRHDCAPKYVPGECCPRYDDCPPEKTPRPLSSNETRSTTSRPPVTYTYAPRTASSQIYLSGGDKRPDQQVNFNEVAVDQPVVYADGDAVSAITSVHTEESTEINIISVLTSTQSPLASDDSIVGTEKSKSDSTTLIPSKDEESELTLSTEKPVLLSNEITSEHSNVSTQASAVSDEEKYISTTRSSESQTEERATTKSPFTEFILSSAKIYNTESTTLKPEIEILGSTSFPSTNSGASEGSTEKVYDTTIVPDLENKLAATETSKDVTVTETFAKTTNSPSETEEKNIIEKHLDEYLGQLSSEDGDRSDRTTENLASVTKSDLTTPIPTASVELEGREAYVDLESESKDTELKTQDKPTSPPSSVAKTTEPNEVSTLQEDSLSSTADTTTNVGILVQTEQPKIQTSIVAEPLFHSGEVEIKEYSSTEKVEPVNTSTNPNIDHQSSTSVPPAISQDSLATTTLPVEKSQVSQTTPALENLITTDAPITTVKEDLAVKSIEKIEILENEEKGSVVSQKDELKGTVDSNKKVLTENEDSPITEKDEKIHKLEKDNDTVNSDKVLVESEEDVEKSDDSSKKDEATANENEAEKSETEHEKDIVNTDEVIAKHSHLPLTSEPNSSDEISSLLTTTLKPVLEVKNEESDVTSQKVPTEASSQTTQSPDRDDINNNTPTTTSDELTTELDEISRTTEQPLTVKSSSEKHVVHQLIHGSSNHNFAPELRGSVGISESDHFGVPIGYSNDFALDIRSLMASSDNNEEVSSPSTTNIEESSKTTNPFSETTPQSELKTDAPEMKPIEIDHAVVEDRLEELKKESISEASTTEDITTTPSSLDMKQVIGNIGLNFASEEIELAYLSSTQEPKSSSKETSNDASSTDSSSVSSTDSSSVSSTDSSSVSSNESSDEKSKEKSSEKTLESGGEDVTTFSSDYLEIKDIGSGLQSVRNTEKPISDASTTNPLHSEADIELTTPKSSLPSSTDSEAIYYGEEIKISYSQESGTQLELDNEKSVSRLNHSEPTINSTQQPTTVTSLKDTATESLTADKNEKQNLSSIKIITSDESKIIPLLNSDKLDEIASSVDGSSILASVGDEVSTTIKSTLSSAVTEPKAIESSSESIPKLQENTTKDATVVTTDSII